MIFEIKDKTSRVIRLTDERWKHILHEHLQAIDIETVIHTLQSPIKIKPSFYDVSVGWYYSYSKNKNKYLLVSVRYLNGTGFVITAYFVRQIK